MPVSRYLVRTAAAALLIATASVGNTASPKGNIVAAAQTSPNHKTLVAAVKAAKLVDTLASKGPFTVFAPTDAAFAKLPAGTVETLVKPENRDQLVKILTYHVVPAKAMASALRQQWSLASTLGKRPRRIKENCAGCVTTSQ